MYRYHEIMLLFHPLIIVKVIGMVGLLFRLLTSLKQKCKIVATLGTVGAGIIIMCIHKYHFLWTFAFQKMN